MKVATYPFQASSQNNKSLTVHLDAGRGWATTTPLPPEEDSVLRQRFGKGVEAVQNPRQKHTLGQQ